MTSLTRFEALVAAAVCPVALVLASGANATSMVSYVHVATAANISGASDEYTQLDHPLINDNPDARMLVTQNWNPPGSAGVYNDHTIGLVYYANFSGGGSWYIHNQDLGAMPEGAAFDVLILGTDTLSFVHLTHDGNSSGRASTLDPIDPDCLLCPSGTRLLFTHTQTAYGLSGGPFDHHASIVYASPTFAIVTESRTPGALELMPSGVFFNLLIADSPGIAASPGWSFTHTATSGNSLFDFTSLSHPQLDGRPGAVVMVSRAGPATSNSPHELGVFYTGSGWAVFFEDGDAMILDSLYNVYIPPLMADGFESGDLSWWSSAVGAAP